MSPTPIPAEASMPKASTFHFDLVAGLTEVERDHVADVGFVFDDEDAGHGFASAPLCTRGL